MKCAVVFTILGFIALASAACYNYQCSAAGGQCGIAPISGTFYECQGGYYCNGGFTAGTCVAQLTQGANCSSAMGGCADGLYCRTSDMTCQMEQWGPGYLCTSDAGCFTYNMTTLERISSTCVAGRCASLGNGAACNTSVSASGTQCANGYYCMPGSTFGQGTCTANPAAGAYCNTTWNYCSDNRASTYLFCSTAYAAASSSNTAGTCVPYFAQAAGANCAGDQHCAEGLVCQNSATAGFGTCATAATSSSNKACNNANPDFSECGALEYCTCTSASSTATTQCVRKPAYPKGFIAAYKSAVSCASDNYNCFSATGGSNPVGWYPSSGCTSTCYKNVCSAFAKTHAGTNNPIVTCGLTSAESNLYNKCLKSAAASAFLAPVVAFVALIAYLF